MFAAIMISFMVAGFVSLIIWSMLGKRTGKFTLKKRIPLLSASVLGCFILCFILSWIGQRALPETFVEVRDRGGFISSVAMADEKSSQPAVIPPSFSQRDTDISSDTSDLDRVLNNRLDIWKSVRQYMSEHPQKLLFGLSVDGSAAEAVNRKDHVHNILIQTLMEGGIPGLALFIALLGYFLFHTIRLWAHWDLPLWQRILPMPVLSVLLLDMAECLTHFAFGHPPMTLMYFFMGCTVATSLSLKKKSADNTAPQTAGE